MPKVQVLPKEVSELIAAGEVIERPASIVKELIENSIDAGASAITVEIQNGGAKYVRVTDDGCGMEKDDAATAFLRHATSKVHCASDLVSIGTLGFRGEALASIAAVAHVELMTKTPESELGAYVKISASQLEEVSEIGCPQGTTIVIRDIFYNVPARLKFLKTDTSEGNAVASIVEKVAVSHPKIAFKFIRDNKCAFSTPGDGKLISAIYTVFGREFSSAMIPVEYELSGVRVEGYVGKPSFSRNNRGMQYFFVNDRYAQSRTCGAALEQAFKGSLMTGRFPCCVLNIKLPYHMVDVNVHPAKIEVRFVSEKSVFDSVYFGVKSALGAADPIKAQPKSDPSVLSPFSDPEPPEQPSLQTAPSFSDKAFLPEQNGPSAVFTGTVTQPESYPEPPQRDWGFRGKAAVNIDAEPEFEDFLGTTDVSDGGSSYQYQKKGTPLAAEEKDPPAVSSGQAVLPKLRPLVEEHSYRYIGEAFLTYILAEIDGSLILIDKHAAHEKILYNRLKEQNQKLDRQLLLTGIPVSLSKAEYQAVLDNEALLSDMGFTAEDFGQNTVMLRAVPAVSKNADPGEMLADVAAGLAAMGRQTLPQRTEEVLHRIACRSAVKANDKNSPQELEELIRRVWEDENVRYCPHGRPVMISFSKKEIEKLFGRLG